MGKLIYGVMVASLLKQQVQTEVSHLKETQNITPGLAVIRVGEDPASALYVHKKRIQAKEIGIKSWEHHLPADIAQQDLETLLHRLNQEPTVHGILLQLPLPGHLDAEALLAEIAPSKDVDGLHPTNAGNLMKGQAGLVPCTPLGCLLLLKTIHPDLSGLKALVIGRSQLVGKPMATLLMQANCTVTLAHSKTQNLAEECLRADIIVVAVGHPHLVKASWVKAGATILDVGMNPDPSSQHKWRGDVDFESVQEVAGALTPVPGGVGPMTVACLLLNTVYATLHQNRLTPFHLPKDPLTTPIEGLPCPS